MISKISSNYLRQGQFIRLKIQEKKIEVFARNHQNDKFEKVYEQARQRLAAQKKKD